MCLIVYVFLHVFLFMSACALPSAGEAVPGCAESALVLPAKSQSGFIEEIDQLTGEIQQLTPNKSFSELI